MAHHAIGSWRSFPRYRGVSISCDFESKGKKAAGTGRKERQRVNIRFFLSLAAMLLCPLLAMAQLTVIDEWNLWK